MTLIEIIKKIEEEKKAASRLPTHALIGKDIRRATAARREDVDEELKRLEAAGLIKTGNTINDGYVVVLQNNNKS